MRRLFGADSLRSDNRFSLGTAPPGAPGLMRRLFGADSLRSDNRFSLGTAPHCGALFDAAPLRRRLAPLGQSVLARHGAARGARVDAAPLRRRLAPLGQSVLAR